MLDDRQAQIVERLRTAAKEHGEVADLLWMLYRDFMGWIVHGLDAPALADIDTWHLGAAMAAASFIAVDRGDADEKD